MNNIITIDDLTYEDFSRLRGILREKRYYEGYTAPESVFIDSAIDKYNNGDYSIIQQKPPKFSEPDRFAEATEPEITAPTVAVPKEPVSNIGKKIFIENEYGDLKSYTLVSSSYDVDPDKGMISIHCDLGKILVNAKEDDVCECNGTTFWIFKILSTLTPQPK